MGKPVFDIPSRPQIRPLGYLSEQEKFALLSRCEALIMPSAESRTNAFLESLRVASPVP